MEKQVFLRAKTRNDLLAFLEKALDVKPVMYANGARLSACPHCGHAQSSSMRLSVRGDQYHCFACGEHGSVVDAAAAIWGCSPIEAAVRLADGEAVMPVVRNEVPRAAAVTPEAVKTVIAELARVLKTRNDDECRRYLIGARCIAPDVIDEAIKRGLLGFMPHHPAHAKAFLLKYIGKEALEQAGFWKPGAKAPGIAFRPIVSFLPRAACAEFRITRGGSDKEPKAIRYGATLYPWFWEGRTDKPALIVEGVIDLLSAVTMQYDGHIIGIPGVTSWKPEWWFSLMQKAGVRRFITALDNDAHDPKNPGQNCAKQIAESIHSAGGEVRNYVPDSGDLNEMLKARNKRLN